MGELMLRLEELLAAAVREQHDSRTDTMQTYYQGQINAFKQALEIVENEMEEE